MTACHRIIRYFAGSTESGKAAKIRLLRKIELSKAGAGEVSSATILPASGE